MSGKVFEELGESEAELRLRKIEGKVERLERAAAQQAIAYMSLTQALKFSGAQAKAVAGILREDPDLEGPGLEELLEEIDARTPEAMKRPEGGGG